MIEPYWEAEGVTLYHGDCLEVLPTLEAGSVDAVVTDPPYGVQTEDWDDSIPPQEVLTQCLRISRGPVIWFGAAPIRCIVPTMHYKPIPERVLIWAPRFSLAKVASNGMFYRWHPIWCWRLPKRQDERVFHKDVIEVNQQGHHWWDHPSTKPIELIQGLVDAWGRQSILDPFMGSGTTGVACVKTGRRFIGIEIDEGYCEIAKQRIEEASLQPRML